MADSDINVNNEDSEKSVESENTNANKKTSTPRKRAPRKTSTNVSSNPQNSEINSDTTSVKNDKNDDVKKPVTPRKRTPRKTTPKVEEKPEITTGTTPLEDEKIKKPVTPRKRAPRKTTPKVEENSEITSVTEPSEKKEKEEVKKPVTPRKRAPRKTTPKVEENSEISIFTESIEEIENKDVKKPVTPRKRTPRKTTKANPNQENSEITIKTSNAEEEIKSLVKEEEKTSTGEENLEPVNDSTIPSNNDAAMNKQITRWEDEGGSPMEPISSPIPNREVKEEDSNDSISEKSSDSTTTDTIPENDVPVVEGASSDKKPTEEEKAVPIKIVNDSRIFSHVGRADFAAYHHQNANIKKFMIAVIAILSFALIVLILLVSFSLSKISHNLQATNAIVNQSIVNSGLENILSAELGEPVANHWYNNENPQIMYAQNHRGDVFRFLLEGNLESDNIKIVGVEELSSQVGKFESTVGLLQPNRSPEISHIITELNKTLEIGVKDVWIMGSPDEQKVAVVDEKNRGYVVDLTRSGNNPDSKIVSVTQVR